MRRKILKNIDWSILICSILLLIIGMVALYSATSNAEYDEFKRQIMWSVIAIPIVVIVILFDYNFIVKCSPYVYGIFILLLIGVFFTKEINGARSWYAIGNSLFQPAEFAKVIVILFASYVMVKLQNGRRNEINKPLKLLAILAVFALPVGLIILQPDYGTAMVFVMGCIFMLFVSGIHAKYILISLLLLAILLPVSYAILLPEHAKARIEVFLDPNIDPRGKGYNIIQSKLAIGAGQLLGMGLGKGNQTQLGFLYPKTTDFIYAVIRRRDGIFGILCDYCFVCGFVSQSNLCC